MKIATLQIIYITLIVLLLVNALAVVLPPTAIGLTAPAEAPVTAPSRAVLRVIEPVGGSSNLPPIVEPLQPITLTLEIKNYSGPAVVKLFNTNLRDSQRITVAVQNDRATFTALARGLPGKWRSLVLIDGELAGSNRHLFTLYPLTTLETGDSDLDALYPSIQGFMEQAVVSYELNGATVRGYRSPDNPQLWMRDHVHQGRGFRYFETDMTSLLEAFEDAQRPDGSFPDVIDYPRKSIKAHRLDPESDLEFLFVQGVYDAWQATGDDNWLRARMPAMRRGLRYITSDPLRWDAERGLVRRPYTIDTWDFEYGPSAISPDGRPAPRHWIDEQTRWGIFHGDNTGLAYAMRLMERLERHLGNNTAADQWDREWRTLMERLMAVSWNGNFFTHFVPLEPFEVPDVDTSQQLSLSNAYALNREVLDIRQNRAIIASYFARRDFDRAFAEWYSIDPPFPPGSYGMGGRKGENPGEYVNGGIMPLVGGELARGAFTHGDEEYGFDILHRYADLIRLTDSSYLWYYPTGQPGISGPDTLATDGWGSSAMLGALMEGAAGIRDRSSLYREVEVSPRWTADPNLQDVRVVARYGPAESYVAYRWQRSSTATTQRLALDLTGTWRAARVRLLLPDNVPDEESAYTVQVNGTTVATEFRKVANSRYIVVEATRGDAQITVTWQQE
ncbi:MAG: hypothetical protein HC876_11610 [Chloroflexaceae bacterium]|nr:hypothetical protein [Chloroflexaceae bacterium]